MVRLEQVDLQDKKLTSQQVQIIFDKITNCETFALLKLSIRHNDLSSVAGDVLVKVISMKAISRQVDLSSTKLTPDKVQGIFDHIANCVPHIVQTGDWSQQPLLGPRERAGEGGIEAVDC